MVFLIFFFFLFPIFLSFLPALGEYRAYQLRIYRADNQTERFVLSTLDDLQYPTYYPLNSFEKISIRSSWKCRGNTSQFRPICPNPLVQIENSQKTP